MNTPSIAVIIVAGGAGTRMGGAVPKQFMDFEGTPVLFHTLQAFHRALPHARTIVVLPQEYLQSTKEAAALFLPHGKVHCVVGGATRYHSVQQGLNAVQDEAYVMVHDAARCLISQDLIARCVSSLQENGSAVPVLPVSDSIRKQEGTSSKAVPRDDLFAVQTPQCFLTQNLKAAFAQPYRTSFTDEASMMDEMGLPVHLVAGEKRNLKITTKEDFIIAAAFLKASNTG